MVILFAIQVWCWGTLAASLIPITVSQSRIAAATLEWERVVGHPISTPATSRRGCSLGALGCYHADDHSITVTLAAYCDPVGFRAVLLHEIGHSFGLKHQRRGLMAPHPDYFHKPDLAAALLAK